jgi:hypothetical protein
MLQLFDFLRGWAEFSISAVWLAMGAAPAAEIVCLRISKEDAAKTHFSRFIARQIVARAEKKLPDGQCCASGSSKIRNYLQVRTRIRN